MRDRVFEAFVGEIEKMGFLASQLARLGASKAARTAAGKAMAGKAMTKTVPKVTPKQGLLKRIVKNPTVRGAASSIGTGLAFTVPGMIMQPRPPKERPQPITSGLR